MITCTNIAKHVLKDTFLRNHLLSETTLHVLRVIIFQIVQPVYKGHLQTKSFTYYVYSIVLINEVFFVL